MKTSKRWQLMNMVFSLECAKGHLKWRVSDLARSVGVSRALIYYHFGKTKADILNACIDAVAVEFYGFSEERRAMARDGRLIESLRKTRSLFHETPALVLFYMKWRTKKSLLQKTFIELERRYQEKLQVSHPDYSPAEIEGLHAILHGLASAPFLSEGGLQAALSLIEGREAARSCPAARPS